eukprot:2360291-Amphidinium_carterae.2
MPGEDGIEVGDQPPGDVASLRLKPWAGRHSTCLSKCLRRTAHTGSVHGSVWQSNERVLDFNAHSPAVFHAKAAKPMMSECIVHHPVWAHELINTSSPHTNLDATEKVRAMR